MARRKKGKSKGIKVPMRPDRPGVLKLTKKDVVRRELASAIRLFVAEGDPVAIYVLASAAAAILHAVGKAKGKETWRTRYFDLIKEEYHEAVNELLDEPFNFMKHGQRDPDAELDNYDPSVNSIYLFLLCNDFVQLFGHMFPEMGIYMALMVTLKPELLNPSSDGTVEGIVASVKNLAGTDHLDLASAARAIENFDADLKEAQRLGISIPGIEAPKSAP